MKPRNYKDRSNRFWLFFILYISSLVLVGFVVHTNGSVSQEVGTGNHEYYRNKYEALLNQEHALLDTMEELNYFVKTIDSLNQEVLAGNTRAQGQIVHGVESYNRKLDSLRNSEPLPLQGELVNTYEKIDELIDINSAFMNKTIQCTDELAENKAELNRLKVELKNCETQVNVLNR